MGSDDGFGGLINAMPAHVRPVAVKLIETAIGSRAKWARDMAKGARALNRPPLALLADLYDALAEGDDLLLKKTRGGK